MSDAPAPERPAMPDLRWSGFTHVGRVRKNNEDALLALTFDGHETRFLHKVGEASSARADFIFAVSDGLGGAKAGEFASRITIEQICRLLPRSFKLSAAGFAGSYADLLPELFTAIHHELVTLSRSYEECREMGTTLSLCWLTPGRLFFCHVGDSRIYYLPQGGGITQLTHDHTHVGWLRRQGKLTEREARSHPSRNALHQALGAGHQFVDPQVGAVVYEAGDRFVLCTDGLTDGLWDYGIEEIVRTPAPAADSKPAAQRLIEASLERSGRDNTTAIVVETRAAARKTSAPDRTRVFVYGTLKRGGENHSFLAGQQFVDAAQTLPGFTLYSIGDYPGMVRSADDREGVGGELWDVDADCLARLDELEGVAEGLYERIPLRLAPPHDSVDTQAYLYPRDISGRKHLGPTWPV